MGVWRDAGRRMNEPEFRTRAQTNIQLFGQLLAAGYSVEKVAHVREAYTLATRLFAGQLRPEGRPFVCHVVGVASILAMVEAELSTILAGLLHSAYSHGDFGYGKGQITTRARDHVRGVVGSHVERVVASYAHHRWNAAAVASWMANAQAPTPDEREFAVIRIADIIEDGLDLGLQLSEKSENLNRDISPEHLAELAEALGFPALGLPLRSLAEDPRREIDVRALREAHAGSHLVCPASWHEKAWPRLVRLARGVWWRR